MLLIGRVSPMRSRERGELLPRSSRRVVADRADVTTRCCVGSGCRWHTTKT
jgi:hypothetical protein